MLKKILSAVLCAGMLLSTVPAVYAADAETTASAPAHISEVYVNSSDTANCIVVKGVSADDGIDLNVYLKQENGELKLLTKNNPSSETDDGASSEKDLRYGAIWDDKTRTEIWFSGDRTLLEHTGLTAGTKYTYVIKEVDANGNESAGIEVSGTPTTARAAYAISSVATNWSWLTAYYLQNDAQLKAGIGYNGSAGIRVHKDSILNNNNFTRFYYSADVTLEQDVPYLLKWKIKHGAAPWSEFGQISVKANGGVSVDGGTSYITDEKSVAYDYNAGVKNEWVDQSVLVKGNGNKFSMEFTIHCFFDYADFDNFELYKTENGEAVGTNLLADYNGDFEKDFEAPEDYSSAYVTSTDTENCIVVEGASAGTDINVYLKEAGGTLKLLTKADPGSIDSTKDLNYAKHWSWGMTDSEYAKLWNGLNKTLLVHSGLTAGTKYTYVIKAVNAYGVESTGIEVSGTPMADKAPFAILQVAEGWKFMQGSATTYASAESVRGIGYEESAGLLVHKNQNDNRDNAFMDLYYSSSAMLEQDKTYKLSWKLKYGDAPWSGSNQQISIKANGGVSTDGGTTYVDSSSNDGAWVNYDYSWGTKGQFFDQSVLVKGNDANFGMTFRIHRYFDYAIFDNFELYEVDAEGNTVGTNLLADYNGDFEADYIAPAAPEKVYVVQGGTQNTVVIESSKSSKFNIYQKAEDGELTKLTLSSAKHTNGVSGTADQTWATYGIYAFDHTGLTNDTEYTYVVKAVNAMGVESDGVEAKGTPSELMGKYENIYLDSSYKWAYLKNAYSYATAEIKNGVGKDGSAGLYVTQLGLDNANGSFMDLVYRTGFTTENEKKYKLTWEQKIGPNNFSQWGYGITQGTASIPYTDSELEKWVTKSLDITGSGNALEVWFRQHKMAKYLIYDNFALYEVDEDGSAVGDNLLKDCNCDFEADFKKNASATLQIWAADNSAESYGEGFDKVDSLNEVYDYYATDTISAKANIKFVNYTGDQDVSVILAIYKKNSTGTDYLYDVKTLDAKITPVESTSGSGTELSIAYTMPSDFAVNGEFNSAAGYSAMLTVWNSVNGMTPIAKQALTLKTTQTSQTTAE